MWADGAQFPLPFLSCLDFPTSPFPEQLCKLPESPGKPSGMLPLRLFNPLTLLPTRHHDDLLPAKVLLCSPDLRRQRGDGSTPYQVLPLHHVI